jgi:hypothetical protein
LVADADVAGAFDEVAEAVGVFVEPEVGAEFDGELPWPADLLGDGPPAGGALALDEDGFGAALDEDGFGLALDEDGFGLGLEDDGFGLGLDDDGLGLGLDEDGLGLGLEDDGFGLVGVPGLLVGGLLDGRGVGEWLLGVSGSGAPRAGPSTVPSTEP